MTRIVEISFQFMQGGELGQASFCIWNPYKTVWHTLITSCYKKLKAHRQIFKKRYFEMYRSCDKACQFSAL